MKPGGPTEEGRSGDELRLRSIGFNRTGREIFGRVYVIVGDTAGVRL